MAGLSFASAVRDLGATLSQIRRLGWKAFFLACFAEGTPVLTPGGDRPIESVRVGDLARTRVDRDGPTDRPTGGWTPGDEPRLRVVEVLLDRDGGRLRARLLLEAGVAVAGGTIDLHLPEMGASGWAQVAAVERCPPLPEPTPGHGLVTATFEHESGGVCDLRVEGETAPIRVTATHPFWSEDRRAWTAVADLRVGERLLALDGSTPSLASRTSLAKTEPVYNIEVDGDHCYRVGQQGLLVHNASDDYERYASAAEEKVFDIANEKCTILTNEGIRFGPQGSVNRNALGRTAEIRDEKYGIRFDVV